ncbi:MAG: hypothetical protein RLY93_10610, partial [Sumerlaeia bacterium]
TWWANGVRYTSGNDIVLANLPDGTPFFFQASSDISDCIAAWSWIGAPPVEFYVPFDGTEVEVELFQLDVTDDDNDRIQLSFSVYVASNLSSPTEIVWANVGLLNSLSSTLRVDFLEGNRLFGEESYVGHSRVTPGMLARFGGENCEAHPSVEFCSEMPAPVGPIRATFSVDGYTSDSVVLDVKNLKGYAFRYLLEPLPEASVPTTPPQFGTGTIFPEERDYPTSPSCTRVGILQADINRRVNAWVMNGKEK